MELSSVFGGDTLKAADLKGSEPTVTIADVQMKKFDNGNKLVVSFEGKKKALVCNKTNANRIAHAYGTDTDNWIGQQITLYTDLVDFQGNTVEAIRVKARKPVQRVRQASADMVPDPPQGSAPRGEDINDEIPFAPEWR